MKNKKESKEFEKTVAYQKYIKPTLEREKRWKREKIKMWFKDNWINLITLIVAILTLLATIILGLLQLLY